MRALPASSSITLLLLASCGSAATFPTRTLPLPEVVTERNEALDDLGLRAFAALSSGDGHGLCLDDQGLREVLDSAAASRAAVVRASQPPDNEAAGGASVTLGGCSYSGICVQHARIEPAGGALGLRQRGFALDRALVVCTEPGGGRVAAWVEGTFVLTDLGFYAIGLQRLEAPRRDHADLDLAPCDLEIGVRSPRPVVVSGTESH